MRNALLTLHVTSGGAWVGGAVCMLLIGWVSRSGDARALDALLGDVDGSVMIAIAVAVTLSGLLLCWCTTWGFFKFVWVIVKEAATLGLMIFSYAGLQTWVTQMVAISSARGAAAPLSPAYRFAAGAQLAGSVAAISALVMVAAVSVAKPWGRTTRRERRAQRRGADLTQS